MVVIKCQIKQTIKFSINFIPMAKR